MTKSKISSLLQDIEERTNVSLVTRKTSIERGWAENLTAAISALRKKGYEILSVRVPMPDGGAYTRYKLVG